MWWLTGLWSTRQRVSFGIIICVLGGSKVEVGRSIEVEHPHIMYVVYDIILFTVDFLSYVPPLDTYIIICLHALGCRLALRPQHVATATMSQWSYSTAPTATSIAGDLSCINSRRCIPPLLLCRLFQHMKSTLSMMAPRVALHLHPPPNKNRDQRMTRQHY